MNAIHRRYLILEHGVGSAVINFFLNGLIAWLMFRSQANVPLWGQMSIAGDTIGTTFFLPFFTCLMVTRLARGHVRSGRIPHLSWHRTSHPLLSRLPATTLRRAIMLGVACLLLIAPPAVAALVGAGWVDLPLWRFITFKATFAAGLAAIVTPIIGLSAIADEADGHGS
jgi:hypothetical protein